MVIENVTVESGGSDIVQTWAPVVVAVVGLLLTAWVFWWVNGHRGKLIASVPRSCGVVARGSSFLLRLPLTIYNTGARALVVGDLRCRIATADDVPVLAWRTTPKRIRDDDEGAGDFPRPFAVAGRQAHSLIVQFGVSRPTFQLDAGVYRVVVEATDGMQHPSQERWDQLVSFEWILHKHALTGGYHRCTVGPDLNDDPKAVT